MEPRSAREVSIPHEGLPPSHTSGTVMIDILYVLGTLGFFALMLAYVAGCARLGQAADDTAALGEPRP